MIRLATACSEFVQGVGMLTAMTVLDPRSTTEQKDYVTRLVKDQFEELEAAIQAFKKEHDL